MGEGQATGAAQRHDGRSTSTVHGKWMDSAFEPALVSVIIPTYNRAALLPETLSSVKRQTYRPIELLVVDDGSSDGTAELMEGWIRAMESDEQFEIRYLRQQNRGAPAARNLGLIESRGEFIQFLDSDDLFAERKVELCVAAMRKDSRVQLAYGPTRLIGDHAGLADYPGAGPEIPTAILEAACVRSVWTIMGPLYRRELCVRAGPWLEELSCWQDREYALRILAMSPLVRFAPEAASFYRLGHGASIGDAWYRSERDLRSIWRGAEAAIQAIEQGCGLTPVMRERLARQFVSVGRLLGQLGEVESGRAALARAEEVAGGTSYARIARLLRLITNVVGFRMTNRCLRLRARLRGRPLGAGV